MARLYGRWNVTLPDEKYVFEPDEITVADMLLLKSELGDRTFDQWLNGIDQREPVECQVLIWYLRRKDGRQEDRMAVDFPLRRLVLEPIPDVDDTPDDELPEAPAGSEPAT